MKHRITLTTEEITALRDRLVPISAYDYDLHTFAILRNLYGRLDHILIFEPKTEERGTK